MLRSSPRSRKLILAAYAVALSTIGGAYADEPRALIVRGGGRELGETPMIADAPREIAAGPYLLQAQSPPSDPVVRRYPAQVFEDRGKTRIAFILDKVGSNEDLRMGLVGTKADAAEPTGVELVPQGRRIEVRSGGKLVMQYVPDDGPKPYFFPLVGPSGSSMTRAYPMKKVPGEKVDHPHHRSVWFTHGSVNKVDFWSEAAGHGSIRETSRPTVVSGPVVGVLRTTDDWLGPDGKKVCEDERVVRIYATKQGQVIDFEVAVKATEGPVTFGDTKEGMFGLRVASSMDVTAKQGGRILNAEGIADKDAWGKASPWVDYSGPVEGRTVGVALLNHPASFRAPTTWHVRDYGLFAANPFGWHDFGQKGTGEFTLPAGQSVQFLYRMILHDGDAASAKLSAAFASYEAPPQVRVE